MHAAAQSLRPIYAYHTRKISELFGPMSASELFFQPYGNVNHLVWELGHLMSVRNTLIKLLNPEEKLHLFPNERGLFGIGSKLEAPENYPTSDLLMEAFKIRGARVDQLLETTTEARWGDPSPYPVPSMEPTVGGQLFGFMLHERMHLGEMVVLRNIIVKNRETIFA